MPSNETITARFVVHRVTEWAGLDAQRAFLIPMLPEWDEGADPDDPVEQVLFDVKLTDIPSDFEFTHKDKDSKGGGIFGEEGIEVELFDPDKHLTTGDIIDLSIRVVGRVEFQ